MPMLEQHRRYRFSVEEWHRMGETGLFDEDSRVELIDGEVIQDGGDRPPPAGLHQSAQLVAGHGRGGPSGGVSADFYSSATPTAGDQVLVTGPSDQDFLTTHHARRGETLAVEGLPGLELSVEKMLGPA